MNQQQLGALEGIALGFNDVMTNLYNISTAREKLSREQKRDDLDFKIKKLELQKAEGTQDPVLLKQESDMLKEGYKYKQQYYKFYNTAIENELGKQKNKADALDLSVDFLSRLPVPGKTSFTKGKDSYTRTQLLTTARNLAKSKLRAFQEPSFEQINFEMENAKTLLSGSTGAAGGDNDNYDPEARFNELIEQGQGEDEAYGIIAEEMSKQGL